MQIYPNTLNSSGVSIQSDEYGMRAYVNSARGRAQLESECPADIVQTVEAVWGTAPTVTEPTLPVTPASTAPTLEDRVSAAEAAILALMG